MTLLISWILSNKNVAIFNSMSVFDTFSEFIWFILCLIPTRLKILWNILLYRNNLSYFCLWSFVASSFWNFLKHCRRVLVYEFLFLWSYLLIIWNSSFLGEPRVAQVSDYAIQVHLAIKRLSCVLILWWMETFSGCFNFYTFVVLVHGAF